jgi:hypothetical protein
MPRKAGSCLSCQTLGVIERMPSLSITEILARRGTAPQAVEVVNSDRDYVALLPLLEHSLQDVERQLQAVPVAVGLRPECIDSISLERLVLLALGSWGEYWPALAMSWLDSGFPVSREIAQTLQSMSKKKGLAQQVRQRAFALEKRWSKSQASPAAE